MTDIATKNTIGNGPEPSILSRLGDRSIVLIGMMGVGKSSIGRRLGARLGIPFVDADAEIEKAAGMSIASITASSRLAGIVGPAHVISESPELAAYEIGGKKPSSVVRPASAEEVVEIVRFASAERLSVVPCGARTKLSMGLVPRQYDLALDLIRLDRVTAYDPGDLTLAVLPGIPLRELAAVLAEQVLAPDAG